MEATENSSGSGASLIPSQALSNNSRNRRRGRNRGGKKKRPNAPAAAGGTNEASGDSKPAAATQEKDQAASKKSKGKGKQRNGKPKADNTAKSAGNKQRQKKKYPWRRYIPPGTRDPITIESLQSLPYPPFALAANEPYTPIAEWPVLEETSKSKEEEEQDEKMSPEEWQRKVLQDQWGGVIASSEDKDKQEEEGAPKDAAPQERHYNLFDGRALDKQEEEGASKDATPQKRHYNLFDGRALAYYLVSQLQFIDPFNRRDLTRDELLNLDAYLVRHGFNDLKVTEAYDAKGVTLSKAGAAASTAEGRAAILQQEANVLLNNIVFGSNQLRQQYAASQQQQQQQQRPTSNRRNRRQETEDTGIYGTDDGAFVVIDDDANPGLRGRNTISNTTAEAHVPSEIETASNTLWSGNRVTENLHHSARARAQNFPALPTPAATTGDSAPSTQNNERASTAKAGPSKSLQRITKVVAPTDPAQVKRQKEAREEAQRRAMMANLNFVAPGSEVHDNSMSGLVPVPAAAPIAPTSGQILRNQAMASALGVVPATVRQQQLNSGWARPTDGKLELDEFGNELNAALYPDSLIEEARERMDQVLKLERKWKMFLADDKSASLPLRPMDRPLRTFVHHYSDFWNLHTESFDREPKRYINCVKLRETRVPVPLLSEVARKWRGPAPLVLPRGPRETSVNETTSRQQQTAGQTTASREFPPAPQREPLKLKPRTVAPAEKEEEAPTITTEDAAAAADAKETQLNSRFDSLFTGRERPKLELASRTVPLELPPYQPAAKQTYDVDAERERQQAAAAERARKEREEAERKAKILAYAFASSDEEESLASAGGSSDWEETEAQFSGDEDE